MPAFFFLIILFWVHPQALGLYESNSQYLEGWSQEILQGFTCISSTQLCRVLSPLQSYFRRDLALDTIMAELLIKGSGEPAVDFKGTGFGLPVC